MAKVIEIRNGQKLDVKLARGVDDYSRITCHVKIEVRGSGKTEWDRMFDAEASDGWWTVKENVVDGPAEVRVSAYMTFAGETRTSPFGHEDYAFSRGEHEFQFGLSPSDFAIRPSVYLKEV